MRRLLSASWFLLSVRLALVALASLPLTFALQGVARGLADGDAQMFGDLVPLLLDVGLREPHLASVALGPLLLLALAALGEPLTDRAAAAINAGHSAAQGVYRALCEAWPLLGVGLFSVLFRLALGACVRELFRGAVWDPRALALPLTASVLLGLFALIVFALRDLACVGGTRTLRERLGVALGCLLRRPLAMALIALAGRAMALAATALAGALALQPVARQGGALLLTYGAVLLCLTLASVARAWRLRALASISSLLEREAWRTDAQSAAPSAPSLDPDA